MVFSWRLESHEVKTRRSREHLQRRGKGLLRKAFRGYLEAGAAGGKMYKKKSLVVL